MRTVFISLFGINIAMALVLGVLGVPSIATLFFTMTLALWLSKKELLCLFGFNALTNVVELVNFAFFFQSLIPLQQWRHPLYGVGLILMVFPMALLLSIIGRTIVQKIFHFKQRVGIH